MSRRGVESDESDGDELGLGSGGGEQGLKINREFAKRFEEKNRRDDLFRAKEKGLLDDEESEEDEEEEDEAGEALTAKMDFDIMKTISLIRNKDKRIYDGAFNPFQEQNAENEEEGEEEQGGKSSEEDVKRRKPLKYKDMVREKVLRKMAGDEQEESSSDEDDQRKQRPMYNKDQAALKNAFKSAVDSEKCDSEAESDDEIIKVKKKSAAEKKSEEDEFAAYMESLKAKDRKLSKVAKSPDVGLMENIFKEKPADENEAFLRKFFLTEGWVDRDGTGTVPLDTEGVEDEDEEDEETDRFEAKYNFRFEEPGGIEIQAHPRKDESSVRRKESARKRQREDKKERLKQEKLRAQEELRRLKNLKRKELESRFEKAIGIAGFKGDKPGKKPAFTVDDLDGDFDPEEWDKKMAATFNDDYYEEDDQEFEEEGLNIIDEELDERDDEEMIQEDEEDEPVDGLEEKEKGKSKKATKKRFGVLVDGTDSEEAKREKARKDAIEEELYKLDYEDVIAGGTIKTRFKYKKVKANDFGLSTEEILNADDKDLNEFVSLKFLAPYREEEFFADTKRRRRLRQKIKERFETIRERKEKKKAKQEKEEQERALLEAQESQSGNASEDEKDPENELENSGGNAEAVEKKKKRSRKRSKKRGAEDEVEAKRDDSDDDEEEADRDESRDEKKTGKEEQRQAPEGSDQKRKRKRKRSKKE